MVRTSPRRSLQSLTCHRLLQSQQQLQSADDQNDVNISDEWDFDDDDADIFNEDNIELEDDVGDEDDEEL